jgi:hypothetical protein
MSVTPINPSTPASSPDLETRVENRKRELIAEIVEHKRNSSRAGAADAIKNAKARLTELAHIVKEGVVDGWANVGPSTRLRLDEWIAR